ncbi:hypothetical protein J1N35_041415 [Gossypium stocksii]|uniref:DDE Tnp4 domain-containing protein n=1 Tax=Gossypium stocksii TaxID=47602 RepID=A0A9D3ZJ92_9ROSI|nr:hypothetical protein J1N35_041415 [Gossypium stocksii]
MELMFVHLLHLAFKENFVVVKGGTTQNVLATITFDLKFSYVLADWEGSAHDSRILSDVLSCPRGLRILEGVDPSDLLNQGLYEEIEFDSIIPTLTK